MPVDAEAAVVGETQSAFAALPDGAVFPAGHVVQVSDDLAPKADENVSSGHVVHVASDSAPREDENFPAPHFVQLEAPASANFPASQSEQVLADMAPKDSEYLPDGQLEQVAEPTDALYLPAAQLVHEPPSGPLKPALHLHALMLVLEEGAVEPAPHFVQSEAPASANFPASQSEQVLATLAPKDAEYLPAGQACLSAVPPGQ